MLSSELWPNQYILPKQLDTIMIKSVQNSQQFSQSKLVRLTTHILGIQQHNKPNPAFLVVGKSDFKENPMSDPDLDFGKNNQLNFQ